MSDYNNQHHHLSSIYEYKGSDLRTIKPAANSKLRHRRSEVIATHRPISATSVLGLAAPLCRARLAISTNSDISFLDSKIDIYLPSKYHATGAWYPPFSFEILIDMAARADGQGQSAIEGNFDLDPAVIEGTVVVFRSGSLLSSKTLVQLSRFLAPRFLHHMLMECGYGRARLEWFVDCQMDKQRYTF